MVTECEAILELDRAKEEAANALTSAFCRVVSIFTDAPFRSGDVAVNHCNQAGMAGGDLAKQVTKSAYLWLLNMVFGAALRPRGCMHFTCLRRCLFWLAHTCHA